MSSKSLFTDSMKDLMVLCVCFGSMSLFVLLLYPAYFLFRLFLKCDFRTIRKKVFLSFSNVFVL